MENEKIVTESCDIPKDYVTLLVEHLGLVKNELFPRTGFPGPAEGQKAAATGWWGALIPEKRVRAREVLEAVASPVMVSDVMMLVEDRQALPTRALLSGMTRDDPVYLVGEAGLAGACHVAFLRGPDVLVNTILLHLDPGSPSVQADMRVVLPAKDLAVFCALVDLSRRIYYAFQNVHASLPGEMLRNEIVRTIEDAAVARDFRWLLPAVLHLQKIGKEELLGSSLSLSLAALEKAGLILPGAVKESWKFSEAGGVIATSLSRRTHVAWVQSVGAGGDGSLGIQSGLVLKSPPLTWFIEPGTGAGGTGVIMAVTQQQAEAALYALLTPSGLPRPLPVTPPAAEPVVTPAPKAAPAAPAPAGTCPSCQQPYAAGQRFCEKCGAKLVVPAGPAVTGPAPGVAACRSCGAPLIPGKKFCGTCGAAAPQVSAPAAGQAQAAPVCQSCGAPLAEGKRFCGRCGAKAGSPGGGAGKTCTKCGAPLIPGKKFCGTCGNPVSVR